MRFKKQELYRREHTGEFYHQHGVKIYQNSIHSCEGTVIHSISGWK